MFKRLLPYLCLLIACFAVSFSRAQLGGVYTIDSSSSASSGNYKNFSSALDDLLNGKRTDGGSTNGPGLKSSVVFKVADGIYYEQLLINPIKGSSSAHTITFTSASADSSKVILIDTNTTTSVNNFTIYLDGASFISFKNMTIARDGTGNNTNVIQYDNYAKGNVFSNDRIIGKKFLTFTSPYPSLVYSEGNYPYTDDSGNTFLNNVMKYNCYGFSLYATSFDPEQNTIIDNNIIDSAYNAGIFMEYEKGIQIIGNTISNVLNSYGLGIYSYYSYGVNKILSNKIYLPNGGEALGLDYNGTIGTDTSIIANNFISVGGIAYAQGIYAYGGDFIKFYYNNVLISGSSPYASYAASLTSTYLYGSHFELINNNLINMQTGASSFTIYNSNNAIAISDYNNLYTKGSTIGFSNSSSYSDLSTWISNTSLDSHSLSINPLFLSLQDLHESNIYLNKKATPLKYITTDIDGQKRDKLHPDIGADEFAPFINDAGITFIDSPSVGCSGGKSIYVHLRNFGISPISSVTISYTVDTSKTHFFKFKGILGVNKDTLLKTGNYTFSFPSFSSHSTIKAWTNYPNGIIDSNPVNDTAKSTIFHGMSGSYTIGGASPNFNSFTDAVTSLTKNGICGAVTFNIRDGIYIEQIEIGAIAGRGSSARVTFQSQSGDSSKVILSWPSTNAYSTANSTLSLNNASWINFKKISIIRSGLGYYGNTVELKNGASDNLFSNNLLIGATIPPADYPFYNSSNTLNSSGDNCNRNTFRNNSITGGSYNCYFNNSSISPAAGNAFIGNTFDSSYWGAIYMQNQNSILLRSNFVENVSGNYGYGFELLNVTGNSKINSNQIVMLNGGIPIYLGYGTKGNYNSHLQITNNFISLIGASGIGDAGIEADYADSIDIIYNNILVYDPSAASSAIYVNSGYASVSLYNNNLVNYGGGYSLFIPSSTLQASNYNNLYAAKGFLGYYNATNISNISGWKYTSSMDTNSISIDPLYYSISDLHVRNSALDGAAKPIPGITVDFDNQKRNPKTPDIGADEFSPLRIDAGVSAIDSPETGFCAGTKNIYVHIRNYGTDTIKVLHFKWIANGINIPVLPFSGNIPKGGEASYKIGNLSFTTGKPVKMTIYCLNPNNLTDSQPVNDTINIILNTGLKGNYTIGHGGKSDYNGFKQAMDDVMSRGLCGAVNFNVYNGIYTEQVDLGFPSGISSKNTLTIQSASGDSSAVILSYPSSIQPANNYTFLLFGTQYLTLKGITLERTGNQAFNNVLVLTAESSNNSFVNNRFIGADIPSANADNYVASSALIYCVPSKNNNNLFYNNYLRGNFWGFYIVGENAGSTGTGITLRNNIIDSTYSGIFLEYEDSFLIEKNTLQNLKDGYYGIQSYYGGEASSISKNKISMQGGGYGLYLFFLQGSNQQYLNVSNNIVEMGNSGYGIYASYLDYSGFYFNTIKSSGTAATPVSTFIGYGSNVCELYNNIFLNKNSGSALSAGKNLITASGNNDYFSSGTSLVNWDGIDYSTLNSFKKANGLETGSLSLKPFFSDSLKYILADTSGLIHKAKPFKNISDDIYGTIRNTKTPDIGAVETNPADTDLSVISILSPASGDCADSFASVSIGILNNGLKKLSGFSVSAIISGATTDTLNYIFPKSAFLPSGSDTVITFHSLINTSKGGTLNIKTFVEITGDKNHQNDTITRSIVIYPRLDVPIARDGNTCGPGTVKLIANSKDSILWYDSSKQFLQSGDSLRTTLLYKTRTYYVQAVSSAVDCGANSPDSAGGYNPSSDFFKGLQFDALADIVIDSMTIYPEKSGVLQLNIRDSFGRILAKKQINISTSVSYSPVIISPEFRIRTGKKYSIDALNSTIGSLYANGVNSKGTAIFPYTVPGMISIKDNIDSSGKSGNYYYFYNWQIHKGFGCAGILKKVLAFVGTGTKPIANFSHTVTCNGTGIFTDSSQSTGTPIHLYDFEFGDSSTRMDTTPNTFSHYYNQRGLYDVLLTVTTTGGCTDSISKWIKITPSLSAAFTLDNSCFGDSVHIKDATYSLVTPLTYRWDFGDSDSSYSANPSHLYNSTGLYRVRLSVASSLCTDTISHFATVYPIPVADFSCSGICFKDTSSLTNSSIARDKILTSSWSFGDGDTLNSTDAKHFYLHSGNYPVELTVSSIHNCANKKDSIITIHSLPDAHFNFSDSSNIFYFKAQDSTLNFYNWNFGDSLTSVTGWNTAHAYVYPKKYTVMLNVRDSYGCLNSYDTLISYSANGIQSVSENSLYCHVYPNPFKESFTISYLQKDFNDVRIEISDLNGKNILEYDAGKQIPGIHSIQFGDNYKLIPCQGVYILKIYSADKLSILRIVKI